MKARLREILRCPACRGLLGDAADALRCAPCRTEYPIVQGVPIFIPGDQLKTVENLPARSGYDPWLHYFTMSSLPRSALILDIGAGDMGLDHPNIVRLDVFLSPHCDVVADAHHLPFADGAFEFVFSLAVLEHLRQPFTAAGEMYRVLRPGGYVYCDTNFVFPYHGFPHHYFNYSIHGIEQVFRQFHKLRVCVPPYQMPSFAIESLLGTYLAYFQPVAEAEGQAVASARALLALPWREFDQHFPPEWAYTCSAGVCFYGMKGPDPFCIPEPVRRAWAGRANLRQAFPAPENLSTAPNLVSWFAETGRGEDPEVDACLDEDPLIPAASLNLATAASAPPPGSPPSPLRRSLLQQRGAPELGHQLDADVLGANRILYPQMIRGTREVVRTTPPLAATIRRGISNALSRVGAWGAKRMDIQDEYIMNSPADQNALNIFKGEWSSQLPSAWKTLRAGTSPLFEDSRILWAAEQFGGFRGERVLELGPLEAGHTYMLESLGAESIVAIEANKRAYLKCLIVKEMLNLKRSRFLLGDFVSFLRENGELFDVCLASGVLYHMPNPAELVSLICRASRKIILWTHFYDRAVIEANATLACRFSGAIRKNYKGFYHSLHKYIYGEALEWAGFCGGSSSYSYWMSRDEILECLQFFGFRDLRIGFEQTDHPNGPSFCVVGVRSF